MARGQDADGTLTYSFVESVRAMHPFYIVRFLGGVFYLDGHADHGVQPVEDHRRREARHSKSPESHCSAQEDAAGEQPAKKSKKNVGLLIVLTVLVVAVGGLVEDRAAVFQKSTTEAVAGLKPVPGVAARRPRPLHPRVVQCHPFTGVISRSAPRNRSADRYSVAARVRLRPAVPVGQQAHRAGPAPRRRGATRTIGIARAPDQSATPGAGIHHAGLSVAGEKQARRFADREEDAGAPHARTPVLPDEGSQERRRPNSRARPRWTP